MATSPIASALEPGDPSGILATAVYVAGSTNLDAGHRYAIAVRDGRILILGPAEVAPDRIALERPVAGLDARSVEGRLVLADPNGLVLAFMGVAGPPTRDVAAAISHAGRGDP